jgi:methionyl-tRNA formyltransferase
MSTLAKEKVALFTCNDLTGLLIANGLVPEMKKIGYEPVIFNTGDHRNRRFKIPTPPVVSFFNAALLRDTIIPTLESLPITTTANHTFRQLADIHEIEYREIADVNDQDFIAEIVGDENMRGGLSERFLQVFGKEVISVFHEKGFLWNLHSGLLPHYKGLLTPYPAIRNGEKTYGMTLHDLTCGIDEGDIVAKGELPLDASKPVLDLYMDVVPVGVNMTLDRLATFKRDGKVNLTPQKSPHVYYTNPTAQEFAQYASQGIYYADAVSSIDRITGLFAEAGTIQGSRLRTNVEDAIMQLSAPIIAASNFKPQIGQHLQLV